MSKFYVWVDDPQTSSSTQTSTEFANEPQRKQGFQANEVISSKKVNTAIRQANLVAVALMEALSPDNTTLDVNSPVIDVTNEIKAKLATLHTTVIDDVIRGDLNAVTSNAVYKALQNKLTLIVPSGIQTDFVLIKKTVEGTVQQISLTGSFSPAASYSTFAPVLRGLQGQLRGQTAPLAQQDDLDLINRAELTEKLSDKLNASNTASIVYGNTNDGSISEPTEIPYTSNVKDDGESIVSRTYDGYFDVKTPVQDLHPVNRKYADETYEKIPKYALIEKIIVGYSVLKTEPEDFTTNYSSYYKTNGKARNDIDFAYVALTEAETFETGKYYSKATESVAINRSGSGNYEPDGTRYAFNNIYAYIDSAANFKGSVFFQYYSIPSHVLLNRVYLDSSATANTHRVQFSVDVKGNMAIAEAAALVDNDKSKTIGTSKNIVKDENFYLAGFYISPLQVDTTVLIYGVRI